MDAEALKKILSDHKEWLKDSSSGRRADLSWANLSRANLSRANLDFSCLPLWCGGAHFKADSKLVRQLMAHICTLDVADADEDIKKAVDAIRGEASKSHRASDLGLEATHAAD